MVIASMFSSLDVGVLAFVTVQAKKSSAQKVRLFSVSEQNFYIISNGWLFTFLHLFKDELF